MSGISFEKLKIMVVQEQKFMNETMETCLKALGFGEVVTTTDGNKAFEVFQRIRPDLVLTDWNAGEINGVDLIRLIRRHPLSPNKMVPIVMITGYGSMRRVTMAANAGVDNYIVQPFDLVTLVDTFEQMINFPSDFVETEKYYGPHKGKRDIH